MKSERDILLRLPDKELLALCRVESFRGTGRGGQKRNVTDSAVRVTHEKSGISAASDATRSQQKNRSVAVSLLRRHLALQWRNSDCVAGDWAVLPVPGHRSDDYALWMAALLDLLCACGYAVGEAAARGGVSTARLARLLAADPMLWQWINQKREAAGLTHLRVPGRVGRPRG